MNIRTTARRAMIVVAFIGLGTGLTAAAPAPNTGLAPNLSGAERLFAVETGPTVTRIAQSRDRNNRRVRIHNQTGWTMLRFYASDARTSDWEEDILGSDTLRSGRSWTINIDDGSGACVYDFKAEFTNGQTLTRMGINVCRIADYYYTR